MDRKSIKLKLKKLIKESILKYSNISLFERRERNFNSENRDKIKTPKTSKINKIQRKIVNQNKENILYHFCQTMTSFHSVDKSTSVLPLLEYFENDKTKTNIKYKNNYHKINSYSRSNTKNDININSKKNRTFNNFYLTETSILKKGNNATKGNFINLFNNINNKKKDLDINTLLLIQSYNNNKDNDNNSIKKNSNKLNINKDFQNVKKKDYSFIKTEANKNNFESIINEHDSKCIINCKISKYKHYQEPGFKDFIKKTQELKLNSYTTKIKRERAVRLEEGYYNQIEYFQDTLNSLQSSKKLLDVDFTNKIADYTRFVMSKKEREKVKSSKILQEIINYRKEIEHLNNKIKKIEFEKTNIIRWIYFQIQVKEKKLVLPSYYKTLIENWGIKRTTIRQMTKRDKNRRNSIRKSGNFQFDSFSFKNKESNNSLKNTNTNTNANTNININNSIINNEKKEDHDKILSYKTNLIFKTPEEFHDRLLSFEKENITLLYYYNELYSELFLLRKEFNLLKKGKEEIQHEYNNIISKKEKELKDIKNMIDEKMKLISEFKKAELNLINEINNEKDNMNSNEKKRKNVKERKKSVDNKKNDNNKLDKNNEMNMIEKYNMIDKKKYILYKKINIIFETCKNIGGNLKFGSLILNSVNKKVNTKEEEMILMLEFIEQSIDYLITNFNNYINKNEEIREFIKIMKIEIEKQHKSEKARLQMIIDLEREQKLKEKVEKRMNKIYILPSKKIDLNKFKFNLDRKKVINISNRIPTIKDYLYNEE